MSKDTSTQAPASSEVTPAEKPVTQVYFMPDKGISVEATSVEDAVAQANLKVKDGDAANS
jgi:hypothetical protein